MLSPGIGQVTHALLTRPPLTFKSLSFIKSPFDLHVLGTPPAFILSQDQTLMFKVCLPVSSGFCSFLRSCNPILNLLCLGCDLISQATVWYDSSHLSEFFQSILLEFSGLHYCLFVKVLIAAVLRSNSVIISQSFCFVNSFLKLFSTKSNNLSRGGFSL